MFAPIKTRRENRIRRISTRSPDRAQIQCLGTRRAGCRGGLEAWFNGPAFEGGVVVLGVDDCDV